MEQYHGTNSQSANNISNGHISVNLGGGELGMGFYTGDLSYQAFNWAWHKYKQDKAVVKFSMDDNEFLNLNPLCLDLHSTHRFRRRIKNNGQTRTYIFDQNAIWAPVVGRHLHNFNQIKFESYDAQSFLNGNTVTKTIY